MRSIDNLEAPRKTRSGRIRVHEKSLLYSIVIPFLLTILLAVLLAVLVVVILSLSGVNFEL